ncbi:MAG: restriction endonuclease subunit S [Gemmatimonadetes bacterium]|nr:restriction endonuclease subunit S [Gemmatimonadota bacterium]
MMAYDMPSNLVPKLRFPEFQSAGEWEPKIMGDIASFFKGKGLPKSMLSTDGTRQCIHYGELFTVYPEVIETVYSRTDLDLDENLFLSAVDDVLMPTSDVTPNGLAKACCVKLRDVIIGGDILVIRTDQRKVGGEFLARYIRHLEPRVLQLVTGSTVYHLYATSLKKLDLKVPSQSEQQKIADCLGSLDALIAAEGRKLESLRQHKQGLMQQLFPQPGETVPRIRFPEFQDRPEWNCLQLEELETEGRIELGRGKVISHADMRANPGPHPVYSSSVIDEGLMGTYGDYLFDEELISWSVDGGGHYFYRPKHKFSVTNVSGYMRVLCGDIVCRFLAYQLQRLHRSQTFDYQQKAHPSVIRALYTVGLPEPNEQRMISDCLTSLDARLIGQTRRLGALKQHKQGLTQQLFPSLEEESR